MHYIFANDIVSFFGPRLKTFADPWCSCNWVVGSQTTALTQTWWVGWGGPMTALRRRTTRRTRCRLTSWCHCRCSWGGPSDRRSRCSQYPVVTLNALLTLCDFCRQDFCRPSERRKTKILRPLTLHDCTRQPRSHYVTKVFCRWHPGHGDPGGLVKTKQCNSAPSVWNTILVMAPFTKQTLLTITAQ